MNRFSAVIRKAITLHSVVFVLSTKLVLAPNLEHIGQKVFHNTLSDSFDKQLTNFGAECEYVWKWFLHFTWLHNTNGLVSFFNNFFLIFPAYFAERRIRLWIAARCSVLIACRSQIQKLFVLRKLCASYKAWHNLRRPSIFCCNW